jgi:hypothetical protein
VREGYCDRRHPGCEERKTSVRQMLARTCNLLIGRAAYETAARMYPKDLIMYCHGARVIERSKPPPDRD